MTIRKVIQVLNQMCADAVIERYAIGGAVGATFYLEPVATQDIDVFVAIQPQPGSLILDIRAIYDYLTARGSTTDGEYIIIAGWPVQFLAPSGPLAEEALNRAIETDVEGVPSSVMTAEHLAAICLQTNRAKDKARVLQFIEEDALDRNLFEEILARHNLMPAWKRFKSQFLEAEI